MFSPRFSLIVLILAFAISANAQVQQPYLVWGSLKTCGSKNLPPDSGLVECSLLDLGSLETFHLKHGGLSISMRYWLYSTHIRIWAEVENATDESIPIDVKSWHVAGYQSLATFNANEKAMFLSAAENPRDGIGRVGRGSLGVPSAGPGAGSLPDGGGHPTRSVAPIPVVAENRPSVTKWKQIRPRSKQSGEVRFDTDPKAGYLRINFNLNGINYIYSLERQQR